MSYFKMIALFFNKNITLKTRVFLSLFSFSLLFFIPSLSYANYECLNHLAPKNFTNSVDSIFKKLDLPNPNTSSNNKEKTKISLSTSLEFFKSSLVQLNGGQKLIDIFENGETLSSVELKAKIKLWAKEFLPGYEILYFSDVDRFSFENSYRSLKIPFLDTKRGMLDDKFLFELYYKKKIPILNQLDLISQILVLAQPKLRSKFERLVGLYKRAQDLGDLTQDDQMQSTTSYNPKFENKKRLSYISTITEMLVGQMVFLAPEDHQRKLVLWGSENLMKSFDYIKHEPKKIKQNIDLSLNSHPNALSYFVQQSELRSRSVLGLFQFLTKNKILSKPANAHLESANLSHEAIDLALAHIDFIQIESGFESSRNKLDAEQSWIHFSTRLYYDDSNPISQILRYKFRFEWINHYINIVEEDISATETEAHKTDPGPLFR